MNAWKPIVAALVIFAAGVVTGGLTVRFASPARTVTKPEPPWPLNIRGARGALLERMQRELYLSPEQRQRIDQVLRESQDRTRQLWESIAPQAHAEQKRVRERIREELNPEQRTKFDESFKVRFPGRFGSERLREDSKKSEERKSGRPNR